MPQYPVYCNEDLIEGLYMQGGNAILRGNNYYEYTFLNRNPDNMHSDYIASSRRVRTEAVCSQFTFGEGSGVREDGNVHASVRPPSPAPLELCTNASLSSSMVVKLSTIIQSFTL
jgi:hypothetical protein